MPACPCATDRSRSYRFENRNDLLKSIDYVDMTTVAVTTNETTEQGTSSLPPIKLRRNLVEKAAPFARRSPALGGAAARRGGGGHLLTGSGVARGRTVVGGVAPLSLVGLWPVISPSLSRVPRKGVSGRSTHRLADRGTVSRGRGAASYHWIDVRWK